MFKKKHSKKIILIVLFALLIVGAFTYKNVFNNISRAKVDSAKVASSKADPNFTLQHYLWFQRIDVKDASSGTNSVKIIDTNNGGKSSGGKLPENGSASISYIDLQETSVNGDTRYTPKTVRVLEKLFEDEQTTYRSNPNITYMDRLYNGMDDYNENYTLTQVWVLKDNKSKDSVSADDFYIYQVPATEDGRHNPDAINFTNNPDNPAITQLENDEVPAGKSKYTILIKENSVIRLVFDTTKTSNYEKTGVNFYDYDISDGYIYPAASKSNPTPTSSQTNTSTWYSYTYHSGINSDSNYSGVGAKYGFGNTNAGTDLGNSLWTNNGHSNMYINRANSVNSDAGSATFKIVKGFDKDAGTVIWNDGIVGPKLFGSSEAVGKTAFMDDQFSLLFNRTGGTYTMTGFNRGSETKIKNLDSFIDRVFGTKHIYSNDFWPMDHSDSWGTNGHDMKFGDNNGNATHRRYLNADGNKNGGTLPTSDDNLDHNGYFGMDFGTEFTIEPGYTGPLDFFFFGDDDLWLFLTDPEGKQTLIADVGGVHSAVGEYVNLWDYVKPISYFDEDGNPNKSSGTYRLNFFYTERGTSGSTLYMRFTIPLDTTTKEEPTTKKLRVEKQVEGTASTNDTKYEFQFDFNDVNADTNNDIYDYVIYNQGGSQASSGDIVNGNKLSIEAGQYIEVVGLPDNLKYTVTETANDAAKTTYQLGTIKNRDLATSDKTGLVVSDAVGVDNYVLFTNHYAGMKVTKKVIGASSEKDKSFDFEVQLGDKSFNKTLGDVVFENGVAKFSLKDGQTKEIYGLPDTEYTVVEKNATGYAAEKVNDKGRTKVGEIVDVKFTNYKFSDLKVEKQVIGDAPASDNEYTFKIDFELPSDVPYPTEYSYVVYDSSNGETGNGTISSGKTFTLQKGEYIVIKDLPDVVKYTITETSHASETVHQLGSFESGTLGNEENGKTISSQVSDGNYVKFTNKYAGIKIKKVVVGEEDDHTSFSFVLTLSQKINGKYGDLDFKDGVANFNLANGETKSALALPNGVTYTVEEENDGEWTIDKQNDTGTTAVGETKEVVFTNYILKSLVVQKQIKGVPKDDNSEYSFTVTLKHPSEEFYSNEYTYRKYNDGDGKYIETGKIKSGDTFKLKANQYFAILQVPDETEFTVTESDSDALKTTYTYTDKEVAEQDGKTVSGKIADGSRLRFTNYYAAISVTKNVTGKKIDNDKAFKFSIKLDASINGKYGDLEFKDGVANFTLKNGQTLTAGGLNEGVNYTVSEEITDGYTTTMKNEKGQTVVGTTTKVEVTNHFINNLTIAKKVRGLPVDPDMDYSFHISFTDSSKPSYEYQKYNAENEKVGETGTITATGSDFTLKQDEYIVINDIDDNASYEVSENEATYGNGQVTYYKDSNTKEQTGSVITGKMMLDSSVTFVNNYSSITVKNVVTGNLGDKNKEFNFKITLDRKLTGKYGDVEFKDGVAVFALKHGQSRTAIGLPAGIEYTVEETDNNGYSVKKYNTTNSLDIGEDEQVEFVNDLGGIEKNPNTNGYSDFYNYVTVVILSVMTICLTIKAYISVKKQSM